MAVDAYALTTLANYKTYAGITTTDDDTLIEALIDRTSDKIETHCDRKFASRDFSEMYDGGSQTILLKNYPVTAVEAVSYNLKKAIDVSSSISTDLKVIVEAQDTLVLLKRTPSGGVMVSANLNYSTYKTTDTMATAIDGTDGFDATKAEDAPSEDLVRAGGVSIKDSSGSLYILDPLETEFAVDEDSGKITLFAGSSDWRWGNSTESTPRFTSGKDNIWVRYTAGYATIPDDLEQICIEMVHELFRKRQHDPTVASEGLGGYSYSSVKESSLAEDTIARLTRWRKHY